MGTKLIKRFLIFMAIMLIAGGAVAADISGKWVAQTSSRGASISESVFTFKVSGSNVTGTIMNQSTTNVTFEPEGQPKMTGKLTTPSGSPIEISDGKISGDNISFVTITERRGTETKTVYSGQISGDEINLTVEINPGSPDAPEPQKLVAKRME